ncbi:MAG: hypothetical protein ABR915_19995 [Thermoguttaceae bacterium]
MQIIGKALGHKTAQATMIYSRLSLDPVRLAVNTIRDALKKTSPGHGDSAYLRALRGPFFL